MLLAQPVNGSNTIPNFCTAFCDNNIATTNVISVSGINDNYDYIAE